MAAMADDPTRRVADTPRESWRLTFHFDGESVQLAESERLPMLAPAAVGEPPRGGENSGAWVEVLDSGGTALYHQLLHDPFHLRAEHHSPDGRIEVHWRPPEPTDFEVIVPALRQAETVSVWATPPDEYEGRSAARMQGQFALHERRGDPHGRG